MKTAQILLAMLVSLVLTMPLAAADPAAKKAPLSPPAQAMLRMQTFHKALEGLELSEGQKAEVKKIHEEFGPKIKEAFEKLKGVLTEEQQAAADAAAKEAKEAGKEGRAFFLAVQSSIQLTAEQVDKVAEIGEELMALHRDSMKKSLAILTAEQRETIKAKMAPAGGKKGKKATQ